jgi:four helix bundle protein
MIGDDIADRLLEFASRILRVVGTLPQNPTGKHVARQLIKSGTSGGANYEEARGAESRADFAHKVLVAAKEVRESVYWVRLIHCSHLSRSTDLSWLVREGNERVAILKASAKTARARAG